MPATLLSQRDVRRRYDFPLLVRTAMGLRGYKQSAAEVTRLLNEQGVVISDATVARRLSPTDDSCFAADELAALEEVLDLPRGFFFQDPDTLLRGQAPFARLSHGHLVALPSIQDRRLRVRHDAPLLTVVAHPQ